MTPFPRVELTTERLRLRPLTASDAEDVHALWHDDRFVETAPPGYRHARASLETATEWCTTGTESRRQEGTAIEFASEPLTGGRMIGHVALFGVNRTTGVAEIHYWTSPWARGRGYAVEAAQAVAEWGLRTWSLSRHLWAIPGVPPFPSSWDGYMRTLLFYGGVIRNASKPRARASSPPAISISYSRSG